MNKERIAQELVSVARSLTALGRFKVVYELDEDDLPAIKGTVGRGFGFLALGDVNRLAKEVVGTCGAIGSKLSRVPVATSSSYTQDVNKVTVVNDTLYGNFQTYCRKPMDDETRQMVITVWRDAMGRFGGREK